MTDVDIINVALVKLGKSPITTFASPGTPAAGASKVVYDQNRTSLLRMAPWNFARQFTSLAQLSSTPVALTLLPDPDYGGGIVYTGAFQLPNDFIRLYRVSPYDAHWRLVGKALLTDAIPAAAPAGLIGTQPANANGSNDPSVAASAGTALGIEYIFNCTDVSQFDQLFVDALVAACARDLAWNLTGEGSMYDRMTNEYNEAMKEAMAVNGMEQWPEQLFDNVMIDVRYGYTNVSGTAFSGVG